MKTPTENEFREYAEKVNNGEPNVLDPAGELKGKGVEFIIGLMKKSYETK